MKKPLLQSFLCFLYGALLCLWFTPVSTAALRAPGLEVPPFLAGIGTRDCQIDSQRIARNAVCYDSST